MKQLSPETAPRSVKELLGVSPFGLRTLLGKMGVLETEEHKMMWHLLSTNEQRATAVALLLAAWDGQAATSEEDLVAETEARMVSGKRVSAQKALDLLAAARAMY